MLCFGVLFIGFGITNAVILAMRVTPFEWVDLQIVKLSLLKVYLEPLLAKVGRPRRDETLSLPRFIRISITLLFHSFLLYLVLEK